MQIKELKIDKLYCILLAFFGLIMSFAIPVMQTPDEQAHIRMIATSLNNEQIADNLLNDLEKNDYKIFINQSKDIHSYKINIQHYLNMMLKEPQYSRSSVQPHGVKLSVIKHLPCTVGLLIGCELHLPSLAVLQLAEAFSVLFYVFIIYVSLRILPIKKTFFRFFAISPMVVQQISSINYDAVLLPLCFMFSAFVLNVKFEKDEFNTKDVLILMSLLLVISYIKIPYFFLGLLILIIPLRKYNIVIGNITVNEEFVKKNGIIIFLSFFAVATFGIYLIRNQYYVRLALGMILELRRTLYLFKSTIKTWGQFLFISSVGNFGWLDTPISIICAISIYLSFFISAFCNDKKDIEDIDIKWERTDYIIVLFTFFLLCILTMMSMVNHTITVTLYGIEKICDYDIRESLYQIPYIGGLQGRYFLPFLMLPFIVLPQKISFDNKKNRIKYIISTVFFLCMALYILCILLNRYWMI